MKKTILALGLTGLMGATLPSFAADFSDGDVHKGDYKWYQFNLIYTKDQYPWPVWEDDYEDTYLELEFGGRSGVWDIYGYVDVFDVTQDSTSSQSRGDQMFMKFAPRLSIDALTGVDLSFGPVKEVYLSTLHNWGGGGDFSLAEHMIGPGADVEIPWLGKVGMNLYARYSAENYGNPDEGTWNGYQFSMNWFKPFYFFDNDTFLSFQGYWDHLFAASDYDDQPGRTDSGGATFWGLFWHSKQYAVGYGAKYFYDVYGQEDGGATDATGLGHYFFLTYKM